MYDKTELLATPYTPTEGGGLCGAKNRVFAKKINIDSLACVTHAGGEQDCFGVGYYDAMIPYLSKDI